IKYPLVSHPSMPYEIIDHTADIGIRVLEETTEKAFETAVRALFELIVEGTVEIKSSREVKCSASEKDQLLVDLLSELLYIFDVEHFVAAKVDATITSGAEGFELVATLGGETLDLARHDVVMEVKAATYHMLEVEGGRITVLFDI
ncbi:MAG: archease, partial [Thermoplasmata archaeon]|nr:archease [Thermoplasmata archaeon]